jgi:hypothetical protein
MSPISPRYPAALGQLVQDPGMPRWKDDKPRPHDYEFANRAIPRIVLDPRVDLAAIAGDHRLDAALRATWAPVGERHDADDRLPDDGLAAELVEVAGQSAALMAFPVAKPCRRGILRPRRAS